MAIKLNEYPERTPIWKIKKQLREAELELELVKKDCGTDHDEIAQIDARLTGLKLEYSQRKAELKGKRG